MPQRSLGVPCLLPCWTNGWVSTLPWGEIRAQLPSSASHSSWSVVVCSVTEDGMPAAPASRWGSLIWESPPLGREAFEWSRAACAIEGEREVDRGCFDVSGALRGTRKDRSNPRSKNQGASRTTGWRTRNLNWWSEVWCSDMIRKSKRPNNSL